MKEILHQLIGGKHPTTYHPSIMFYPSNGHRKDGLTPASPPLLAPLPPPLPVPGSEAIPTLLGWSVARMDGFMASPRDVPGGMCTVTQHRFSLDCWKKTSQLVFTVHHFWTVQKLWENPDELNWLVVGPPLWKIWVRQLGWWQQPNICKNKKWQPNHQPVNVIVSDSPPDGEPAWLLHHPGKHIFGAPFVVGCCPHDAGHDLTLFWASFQCLRRTLLTCGVNIPNTKRQWVSFVKKKETEQVRKSDLCWETQRTRRLRSRTKTGGEEARTICGPSRIDLRVSEDFGSIFWSGRLGLWSPTGLSEIKFGNRGCFLQMQGGNQGQVAKQKQPVPII